mgnify:CR=1 FL=1
MRSAGSPVPRCRCCARRTSRISALATDHVIRSFRNDLYEDYKTEEGVPEDLMAQFPLAERALEAIGVVVWRDGGVRGRRRARDGGGALRGRGRVKS